MTLNRRQALAVLGGVFGVNPPVDGISGAAQNSLIDQMLECFSIGNVNELPKLETMTTEAAMSLRAFFKNPESERIVGEIIGDSEELHGTVKLNIGSAFTYINHIKLHGAVSPEHIETACQLVIRGLLQTTAPSISGEDPDMDILGAVAKLDAQVCKAMGWKTGSIDPSNPSFSISQSKKKNQEQEIAEFYPDEIEKNDPEMMPWLVRSRASKPLERKK